MQVLEANGFDTLDGVLYRNNLPTNMVNKVLMMKENRHLVALPMILPIRTKIKVSRVVKAEKQRVYLWD